MNLTYDWEKDEWTALALGVKLAELVKFDRMPVQFCGACECNFDDDDAATHWTVSLIVKLLFPA